MEQRTPWPSRSADLTVMALAWTAVWILGGAGVAAADPSASTDRLWVPLAQPALLCGVLFAGGWWMGAAASRLARVRLPHAAAWGGCIGMFVGGLPFAIGEPTTELPLWLLGLQIVGPVTLLSAAAALASVALARVVEERGRREAGSR